MIITVAVSLVSGALITSYVEYKFQYNLFDKIKDIFSSAKKVEQTVASDVKKI